VHHHRNLLSERYWGLVDRAK